MKSKSARILLVDDDAEIREVVQKYLEDHGFEVLLAGDGPQALERCTEDVELIILDLHLPTMDGLEVVSRLRLSSAVPILICSARGEGADRIAGLEMGADDYLTKPFLPRELVARVKALLRRARMPSTDSATVGPLVIDNAARRVTLRGQDVELTPLEYNLLRTMSGSPGRTFTRDELLDRVWGPEYIGDSRRVDIHVSKLRAKLTKEGAPSPIRSIWGVGYRYEP